MLVDAGARRGRLFGFAGAEHGLGVVGAGGSEQEVEVGLGLHAARDVALESELVAFGIQFDGPSLAGPLGEGGAGFEDEGGHEGLAGHDVDGLDIGPGYEAGEADAAEAEGAEQ